MRFHKLKYHAKIVSGQAPSGDSVSDTGEIPFLQGCAEFGPVFPFADKYCDAPSKLAPKGSLLVSVRAPVGRMNVADQKYGIGRGLAAIFPGPSVNGTFLKYSIESAIPELQSHSTGSTYDAVSGSDIGNIAIAFPDLATQRQIADFLDRETARIDLLIEKKQRLVALLPEKEKNEISRLVMRGSDHSVTVRDTGIFWRGTVPAHWTESRLKANFRIQKRQGFDDLTVLSVYREYGVIEKSSRDDNINKTPEDLSKYQLVEPGDLVINKMKSWQGSLGVSAFKGITSPDYVVMTPCAEHHSQYMHHLLRAVPMPTVYHLISNGIRTDQWRMEPDRFLSLPVFLPPMEEQQEIARKVDEELARLRNVADAINASIDRLKEYRSALITAAVTGQIDLTAYANSGTPTAASTPFKRRWARDDPLNC